MSARYAIGVGAKRGVDARALADFVAHVAADAGVERQSCAMFALDIKIDDAGVAEAARILEMNIEFLPIEALLTRKGEVLTSSARVEAMTGVGSVAEAAALVGAGAGSVLLAPRTTAHGLACAIARGAETGGSA
jgi:cobalt-precorrin 5A hydrolase